MAPADGDDQRNRAAGVRQGEFLQQVVHKGETQAGGDPEGRGGEHASAESKRGTFSPSSWEDGFAEDSALLSRSDPRAGVSGRLVWLRT